MAACPHFMQALKCSVYAAFAASVFTFASAVHGGSATNDLSFTGPEFYPIDDGIFLLHAADLDGDGLNDLVVVNKGDRPGAGKLQRELEMSLDLRSGRMSRAPAHHGALRSGPAAMSATPTAGSDEWRPPVLVTTASKNEGIDGVVAALESHWRWLATSGMLDRRRRTRLSERTREVVERAMRKWLWHDSHADEMIAARLDDVASGRTSPYELASDIVAALKEGARV